LPERTTTTTELRLSHHLRLRLPKPWLRLPKGARLWLLPKAAWLWHRRGKLRLSKGGTLANHRWRTTKLRLRGLTATRLRNIRILRVSPHRIFAR
jgi:hypothetical protein